MLLYLCLSIIIFGLLILDYNREKVLTIGLNNSKFCGNNIISSIKSRTEKKVSFTHLLKKIVNLHFKTKLIVLDAFIFDHYFTG